MTAPRKTRTPAVTAGTGTTLTSFQLSPAFDSAPNMLYQTANCAGYSPVTRLPLTSARVLIGESFLTIKLLRSGEPRMSSRELATWGNGFLPPTLKFAPR